MLNEKARKSDAAVQCAGRDTELSSFLLNTVIYKPYALSVPPRTYAAITRGLSIRTTIRSVCISSS
jgi:hypothetical protein